MFASIVASEGGYQQFELGGGEMTVLLLSVVAALTAIAVGFQLMRGVLAAEQGTPKMIEIALAIQVGAAAYLRRQFRTIAVIMVPVAAIVFLTSTEVLKPDGVVALSRIESGTYRTLAFVAGAFLSGLTGFIGMTLATRGNVRTAAAAKSGSLPAALKVAFRTGGVAGMFTVGLGLLGATLIILMFQNTSSAILVGFGFGGSLIALFLRVGGGIFTKAADVGADLVGKVEAGIPEDDPRNPATIADNVGDNVGDCAGMAADLFESYEVTLVASIILGVPAFAAIGANPALGLVFPVAARAVGVIASIAGVYAVRAKEGETNALKPINRGFPHRRHHHGDRHGVGGAAVRRQRQRQRGVEVFRSRGHRPRPRPSREPPHRVLHRHRVRTGAGDRGGDPHRPRHHRAVRHGVGHGVVGVRHHRRSRSRSARRSPSAAATSSSPSTSSPSPAWACWQRPV